MVNRPQNRQVFDLQNHSINFPPIQVDHETLSESLIHESGQITDPIKCDIPQLTQERDNRGVTLGNSGSGTDKSLKHWKRRVRDKGKEVVMHSESIPTPGSKRGMQYTDDTISQDYTSPSKKKNKPEVVALKLADVTVVVAPQPRRSL